MKQIDYSMRVNGTLGDFDHALKSFTLRYPVKLETNKTYSVGQWSAGFWDNRSLDISGEPIDPDRGRAYSVRVHRPSQPLGWPMITDDVIMIWIERIDNGLKVTFGPVFEEERPFVRAFVAELRKAWSAVPWDDDPTIVQSQPEPAASPSMPPLPETENYNSMNDYYAALCDYFDQHERPRGTKISAFAKAADVDPNTFYRRRHELGRTTPRERRKTGK